MKSLNYELQTLTENDLMTDDDFILSFCQKDYEISCKISLKRKLKKMRQLLRFFQEILHISIFQQQKEMSNRHNKLIDKLQNMYCSSDFFSTKAVYNIHTLQWYSHVYNIHTLQWYLCFLSCKINTVEDLIELKRRKRNYKNTISDLIRLNRVLCFDVVFIIKEFLI